MYKSLIVATAAVGLAALMPVAICLFPLHRMSRTLHRAPVCSLQVTVDAAG